MILLASATSSLTSIIVPLAIVLVFTGVLLAILSVLKRRMGGELTTPRDFTLTELRDLHRQGKLSDEEFGRAKSLLVEKVHSKLAKEAKPSMTASPLNAELKSEETK
jgi:hypothetical protein